MSNFIRCQNKEWVNLDFVAKIVKADGMEGIENGEYRLMSVSGEVVGTVGSIDFDPDCAVPLVPAHPGEAMFEFYSPSTERMPVSVNELIVIEQPILGWWCSQWWAKPVVTHPSFDRGANLYLYRLVDGRFREIGETRRYLANLDEAKSFALEKIRAKFD